MASFATPTDMMNRYDANRLGQLVKDDGTQATTVALLTDPVLLTMLDDATQFLRSAFIAGNRYSDADLTAFMASTSAGLLIRLCCDLSYGLLFTRRGYSEAETQNASPRYKTAMEMIAGIRDGQAILDLANIHGSAEVSARTIYSKNVSLVTSAQRVFGNQTVTAPGQPLPGTQTQGDFVGGTSQVTLPTDQ